MESYCESKSLVLHAAKRRHLETAACDMLTTLTLSERHTRELRPLLLHTVDISFQRTMAEVFCAPTDPRRLRQPTANASPEPTICTLIRLWVNTIAPCFGKNSNYQPCFAAVQRLGLGSEGEIEAELAKVSTPSASSMAPTAAVERIVRLVLPTGTARLFLYAKGNPRVAGWPRRSSSP